MSKYVGSKTVIICFLIVCYTVLYIRKVSTASSQACLAVLSCTAVPDSITDGAHPGAVNTSGKAGAQKNPSSPWEMIHLPGGDNAVGR
jgi:hypothetical protein